MIILQSLRVRNFGPYYGEQTLDLSVDAGSPVILVHGENTLGKTQLFAALRWCLYGAFEQEQSAGDVARSLRGRFNRIAMREGDHSLEVQVTFTAGDTYVLTRRATEVTGRVEVSADLRIGATVVPGGSIDAEIGRLLHPQISEFFLFDAELLERFYDRLNTDRERGFIRDSIWSVLGIPALQLAAQDVLLLGTDAAKRQAKAANDQKEAESLKARARKLASDRDSVEADRRGLSDAQRDAERVRDQLRDQMGAVQGLEADAREQELLEAGVADGEREEARLVGELRRLISNGWIAAAATPLSTALDDVKRTNTRAQQEQVRIQSIRTRVALLEDRMKGGTCPSCGQILPAADEDTGSELTAARASLDEVLQASGGGEVDLAGERRLNALVDRKTASAYRESQNRRDEIAMLQYERRRQLAAIADRLQGHHAADIRALGQRLVTVEKAINKARQDLLDLTERLDEIAVEEQSVMRRLTKLPGAQKAVALEAAWFSCVRTVLGLTIDRYQERVRAEVETAASSMFLRLIRDPEGYGGLRISGDYRVEVLDRFKAVRETSEGGKQLLALSLIGALKHAAVRGGPVVLDSPLGRLDLEHRANVLQTSVPSLGNQAVLLIHSGKSTVEDARRLLGARIGREYRILGLTAIPTTPQLKDWADHATR